MGTWEGLVDARTGELLAFQDKNQYDGAVKRLQGGVYPVSNDQIPPDGIEQPGFPMPFADIRLADGSTIFTNTGGVDRLHGIDRPRPARDHVFTTRLSASTSTSRTSAVPSWRRSAPATRPRTSASVRAPTAWCRLAIRPATRSPPARPSTR